MVEWVTVTQGEFAVSGRSDVAFTTILGSCIACCLWDPARKMGGMNHLLLAGEPQTDGLQNSRSVNVMELLINELIKSGARRESLQAKVFGGATMIDGLSNIGAQNIAFTFAFLEREHIPCTGQSVGGKRARRVHFWPASGIAKQKLQCGDRKLDTDPADAPTQVQTENGVELF